MKKKQSQDIISATTVLTAHGTPLSITSTAIINLSLLDAHTTTMDSSA